MVELLNFKGIRGLRSCVIRADDALDVVKKKIDVVVGLAMGVQEVEPEEFRLDPGRVAFSAKGLFSAPRVTQRVFSMKPTVNQKICRSCINRRRLASQWPENCPGGLEGVVPVIRIRSISAFLEVRASVSVRIQTGISFRMIECSEMPDFP